VRVYVPEGVINRISMNQAATVKFDGMKDRFNGRVIFVAPKAEFTPRNVQTPEERVTQTFAVKVRVEDPELFLRPGVAADVVFDAGGK
jgi:HlyD family secretion protein